MRNATIMTKNGGGSKMDVERPDTLVALEALLRRGIDFYCTISPALAEGVLSAWNTSNRRIDEVRVQAMKRDMTAMRWLSGEVIGFGILSEGIQVGDGQHRLRAQVGSGTEQVYRVRCFTDEIEFARFVTTRDSGKARSLADLLSILGLTGSPTAFERVANAIQTFNGAMPSRLTKQERLDFAFDRASEIKYVLSLPTRSFRAHTLAAVAIAYRKYPKPVADFMAKVISGAELPAGSPALELSKALPDLNAARGAKEKDRTMATVLRVINDGIRGKRKTVIKALLRTDNSPIVAAIEEFSGANIAKAWLERTRAGK
jgi:hypothetical protein